MRLFNKAELAVVNNVVSLAEDLVCNHYKMSANQWLRHRYDVKSQKDLVPEELVDGPFAQIVRYSCSREGSPLGSSTYDFYKICLQDKAILKTVKEKPELSLFPFVLYIVVHELIHIVRFAKFYQNFEALPHEKQIEETRVHQITQDIVGRHDITGAAAVIDFYSDADTLAEKIY